MSRVINGLEGNLTVAGGIALKARAWQLVLAQAAYDQQGFSDNGHQTVNGGTRGGSGKFSGWLNTAGAGWAAIEANGAGAGGTGAPIGPVTLTATTGYTYSCFIVITSVPITVDIGGNATVEFDFMTSGIITESNSGS